MVAPLTMWMQPEQGGSCRQGYANRHVLSPHCARMGSESPRHDVPPDLLAPNLWQGGVRRPGVTNVLSKRMTASPDPVATRGVPARRVASVGAVIETLEVRGLMSTLIPSRLPHELAEPDHRPAEVGSSAVAGPTMRNSSAKSLSSPLDDQARTTRPPEGSVPAPSSAARSNPVVTGASKRSTARDISLRLLADPLAAEIRHPDPMSNAQADITSLAAQETISGANSGAGSDPAGPSSLVTWTQSAAMPIAVTAANPCDLLAGLEGRVPGLRTSGTGSVSPRSFGSISLGLDIPGPGPVVHATALDINGNVPSQLPSAAAAARGQDLADLLEGALHPDWDSVDRELRDFLAELGGMATDAREPRAQPRWLIWVGAAAALLLTRRTWYRPRRFFDRPVRGAPRISAHGTVSVGPWPLIPQ